MTGRHLQQDPTVPRERPWLAFGIACLLFALMWLGVHLGLAWWERLQERDWAVVRQTVPVAAGHGRIQDGGWTIDADLAPMPVRMMRDHMLSVRIAHQGRPVPSGRTLLRLRVPAMPMIDVTAVLVPQGDGRYVARLVLPLCSTERAAWVAQVRCDSDGRQIGGGFAFDAYPPSAAIP